MCYENRLSKGKIPACVQACPEEAAIFGERKALIKIAKKRLKEEPEKYIQTVFGEDDAGGTSVMYISDMKINISKLKSNQIKKPLPEYTKNAMKAVPPVFLSVGALMYGTESIPKWLVPLCIPVSFSILFFRVIQCAIQDIKDFRNNRPLKLDPTATID